MGLRSAGNSHWLLAEEVIRAHEEDPGPVPGVWAEGRRLTDLLTRRPTAGNRLDGKSLQIITLRWRTIEGVAGTELYYSLFPIPYSLTPDH